VNSPVVSKKLACSPKLSKWTFSMCEYLDVHVQALGPSILNITLTGKVKIDLVCRVELVKYEP